MIGALSRMAAPGSHMCKGVPARSAGWPESGMHHELRSKWARLTAHADPLYGTKFRVSSDDKI